jgi:alkanesulfonate monooxygenase SsuD/methylene tetrahydromethanopterin reductase-like flavin-dependent oxidoreductase (luciferase family)
MEEGEWPRYFVGTPSRVKGQLEKMATELGIEELIVNTIVWDHAKRLQSYELLAEAIEPGISSIDEPEKQAV